MGEICLELYGDEMKSDFLREADPYNEFDPVTGKQTDEARKRMEEDLTPPLSCITIIKEQLSNVTNHTDTVIQLQILKNIVSLGKTCLKLNGENDA